MKRIIYRVTLDNELSGLASATLSDFEKFVDDAHEFGIGSDAPIQREPGYAFDSKGGPLMVERVVLVEAK